MHIYWHAVRGVTRLGMLLPLIAVSLNATAQATNCNVYNFTQGPFLYSFIDKHQHTSGAHYSGTTQFGASTYTGTAQPNSTTKCSSTAIETSSTQAGVTGVITPSNRTHFTSSSDQNGTSSSNGAQIAADAEGVGAVESCVGDCLTGIGITISGNGAGAGFTISYSVQPLWSAAQHSNIVCAAMTVPPSGVSCPTPIGNPPNRQEEGYTWEWDTATCQWVEVYDPDTPIVFDTTGKGFKFTDPTKGQYVTFDFKGNGTYEKLSWPEHGSGNAWLVLDDDGSGIISNGTQLFGNVTAHSDGGIPKNPDANGFLALGWWDHPENGGIGHLVMSSQDSVWPKLRLWIDEHCYQTPDEPCQSRPDELHTLESLGITSFSLDYQGSFKTDAIGNKFRFKAVVNPDASTAAQEDIEAAATHGVDLTKTSRDTLGRIAYDVFLKRVP